jgi:hypothetical protein
MRDSPPRTPRRPLLAGLAGAIFLLLHAPLFGQLKWEATEIQQAFTLRQEQGEAVFRFKNAGTYPVTIRSTSSSCGCTTAELTRRTYYPGDEGEIVARFTVGDRVGTRRNTIQVQTNDPREPSTTLAYIADIPALVTITPRLLRWTAGEEPEARVARIKLNPEAGLEVTGVQVDNDNFAALLKPGEAEGEFLLELSPRETKSPQRAIISLQTSPKLENQTHFSFYAYIR